MSWIVNKPQSQEVLAETFLSRVQQTDILKISGAYDGMSAIMAQKAGFEALYLSGAAYTASKGLPDLGMITSTEMAERARELVRATDLPVLVDIDTGYGGVLNVARTASEMYEAGVAAVQIEDQQLPKKCGHLNGKQLVTPEDMMQKIRTLKEVAPSLVVVARTDAKGVYSFSEAIKRAEQYIKAGADAIFMEALMTEEEFRQSGEAISVPLLANMTEFGKTPYFTADQFASFGFDMVIYPVTALRVAAKAYEKVFQLIMQEGTQEGMLDEMQTRAELYEAIQYYDFEGLDDKIAETIIPEIGKDDS